MSLMSLMKRNKVDRISSIQKYNMFIHIIMSLSFKPVKRLNKTFQNITVCYFIKLRLLQCKTKKLYYCISLVDNVINMLIP